jgi:hypothetical protein
VLSLLVRPIELLTSPSELASSVSLGVVFDASTFQHEDQAVNEFTSLNSWLKSARLALHSKEQRQAFDTSALYELEGNT